MLTEWINQLKTQSLSEEDSYHCLQSIFTKDTTDEQIVTFLNLLADKGESVDEIVGFVRAMRDASNTIDLAVPAIDLCGTGGSGKERFNVSTSVAFILSALDIPVAKHGNRGSRKPNGSFDFLDALNIRFDLDIHLIKQVFDQTQLCFLFARNHHPSMGRVAPARKAVGRRTIFNLIGPLCNPASVPFQIIGTLNTAVGEKLAKAIHRLGTQKSLVIIGADEIDELSTTGISTYFEITAEGIKKQTFNPLDIGITPVSPQEIEGGSAEDNATLFKDLFSRGIVDHKLSELICLNAGAAIYCFGQTNSIQDGYMLAQTAVKSGHAWKAFESYKQAIDSLMDLSPAVTHP